MSGPLITLVATPIGNLGDISHRAVEALTAADVIACEDTRRTAGLLRHLGIERRQLVVVNDHTERDVAGRLVDEALAGRRVVLVSDAGMPGISDPGYVVVGAAIAAGVRLEVVPGASALLAALVLSGLPTDRFAFDGFLPRKGAERTSRLVDVAVERRTVVLYEAPHRLERTLVDLAGHCGADRRVAVARELTKLYEEVWRGTLADAVEWAQATSPRGEIVIVVEGAPEVEVTEASIAAAVAELIDGGATVRDAADQVAERLGVRRRLAYDLALRARG
ncbi:MAG: 16S rRNA (cytidine(1402)-2'-O)-methyltransferase [Acidimicrobiales bacterium]